MKKNVLFLILVLFVFGCKDREIRSITDLFDSQEQLSYKLLDIEDDSDVLLSPAVLLVEGKQMIIHTTLSPQLFASVDLESNTVTKTWGDIGNGPGEFLVILDFYRNHVNAGINAWDPMSQRLNFYPFEKIFSNDTTLLPVDLFEGLNDTQKTYEEEFYINVLQLSDTKFLGLGNNDDKRFTLIDLTNKTRTATGDFPPQKVEDGIPHLFRIQAYQGILQHNSKQNKVAYLSSESEMFEIFKVNDSGLDLVFGNYTTIPKYAIGSMGGDNDGGENFGLKVEKFTNGQGKGVSLATSEDKIWILYQEYEKGATDDDMEKFMSNDANKILVFDWDGKPLKMYTLDCVVSSIEYDAQSNRLYAIKSKPDPEIVYFEL